jgi:hypothetical protein
MTMGVKTNVIEFAAGQILEGNDVANIVLNIVHAAAVYFEECPDDFCLQHLRLDTIVFGSTNRLIWSPLRGFFPDPSCCTREFLVHAGNVLPGRVH